VIRLPTLVLVLLLAGLAGAACGDGGGQQQFCRSPAQVLFDPDADLLLPFPSNLYLRPDRGTATGFRLDLQVADDEMFQGFDFMPEQLNRLDGFGTSAAIVFGFSREIGTVDGSVDPPRVSPPSCLQLDPARTTGADSPIVLLNIEPTSPDHGRAVPLLLEYVSDPLLPGRGRHLLLAEPAFPLHPATTYVAALASRLTDRDGNCIAPTAATRDLLLGKDLDRFGLLGQQVDDARRQLLASGFVDSVGQLSAITVFTTQSIEEQLLAARDQVRQQFADQPPQILPGSLQVTEKTDDDDVAAVVSGRFLAPSFQSSAGTFVIGDGVPQLQGQQELEFELVLPRAGPGRSPPFPVIIYQHGLLGWKEQDAGAKRAQARAGFASLAIDAVLHGSRRAPSGWEATNFFGINLNPGPGEKAFDMELLRDNFRQSYLDVVSEVELVRTLAGLDLLPAAGGDGRVEVAAAPVYLSGHSLGGIIAAGAAALSPDIQAVNISAGGGSLPTNLFMRSQIFGSFIDMLAPEGTSPVDVRRFMPVLQVLTERGDPVNLARQITGPGEACRLPVLQQEVLDDAFVPNTSNEALARSLGLDHLSPVLRPVFGLAAIAEPASGNRPGGITAGFFQFDVLSDGAPAEHTEIYADPLAQQQWIHFFSTLRDSGRAELVDPYRLLGIDRN